MSEEQQSNNKTSSELKTSSPSTNVEKIPVANDVVEVEVSPSLEEQQSTSEESLPAEEIVKQELKPGMTIRIHQTVREGEKSRIQIFQGMIIAMRGQTPETKTMTVAKNSFGIRVEKIFPLASPLIQKIEVVKIARVRRAKLYFLSRYRKRLREILVKT